MNRLIKDTLLYYRFRERRVTKNSKYVVLFERGLFSDYFDWIVKSVPKGIDIIELRPRPFFVNKHATLDYCKILLQYKLIFFHSPGESLQHKCLKDLNNLYMTDRCIGFQHGLIGENPPSALPFVLSRVKSKRYISFEPNFSRFLKEYSSTDVVEFLFSEPVYSKKFDLPNFFDCYFDAPDKGTLLKNVLQLRKFLKLSDTHILNCHFHPSTSFLKKSIVKFVLANHIMLGEGLESDSVICWDSKIKFELSRDGKNVYKLHNNNLEIMNLTDENFDFEKHVQKSLEFMSTSLR